ncbi:MAG: glycerol-3-phosphate acyltransferase PlsY [Candidatus Tokpelaia sp. JSC085]|nr:MAG: glycerol-3-phosphate acyltransferase PlsY [Candidatus Tokpelaia sp. JSC085]
MIINLLWTIAILLPGYLLGSIPCGLIFTRFAGLNDIRTIGSGNTGATNVLRTGSRTLALLTLLCDILKGLLSVLIFSYFTRTLGILAGFFAVLGHIFPIWIRFKGGKGVATYLGVLIALSCPCAFIFVLIWLMIALISRYSSLASLTAVIVTPFLSFFYLPEGTFFFVILISMTIILQHHSNLKRLYRGSERRIGREN